MISIALSSSSPIVLNQIVYYGFPLVYFSFQLLYSSSLFGCPIFQLFVKKNNLFGFPGGPVVNSPPCNAGDISPISGLGRSHMLWSNRACVPQLLILCSRACKLQLLKAMNSRACAVQEEKPLQWEAQAPELESGHLSLKLEKACAHSEDSCSQNKTTTTTTTTTTTFSPVLDGFTNGVYQTFREN